MHYLADQAQICVVKLPTQITYLALYNENFQMPYFHSFKAKSKHGTVFILWKFTLSVSRLPVNSKASEKNGSFI